MEKQLDIFRNPDDSSITITGANSYYSLIWLHGLGDSSEGFFDDFQKPFSPIFHGGRVKLLQAPCNPVTLYKNKFKNSWYNVKNKNYDQSDEERFSVEQINASLKIIDEHVEAEIKYWKSKDETKSIEQICKRIFIGGFSQGCAMSLTYGLTSDKILGGIIGMSGILFKSYNLQQNKGKVPILAFHGSLDEMIEMKRAKSHYEKYLGESNNFKLIEIADLDHSVTWAEEEEAMNWIYDILKEQSK